MKRILAIFIGVVSIVGIVMFASASQFDVTGFSIDDSGNVTAASVKSNDKVELDKILFSVTVDTTSVSPTAAGQVILGTDYNLYVSSAAGGSWYKIGGK